MREAEKQIDYPGLEQPSIIVPQPTIGDHFMTAIEIAKEIPIGLVLIISTALMFFTGLFLIAYSIGFQLGG